MDFERLLLLSRRVQLVVDEWYNCDGEPPRDYQGPCLVVIAMAGRITALTGAERIVRPLADSQVEALLRAVVAAGQEDPREGVDTAIGRTQTCLRLYAEHARVPLSAAATVNHSVPHALPPHWSTLLRLLRDAIGPLPPSAADAWDVAMTWSGAVDLGAAWHARTPVRMPHRVTAFEHDGPLYLRTGQPPGPSRLYQLADDALLDVEHRRVIPAGARGWDLPCGGGRVTVRREWPRPPRVIVTCNDERGVYVQAAER